MRFRVSVFAETIAEDGMELKSYDYIDGHSLSNLPSEETIAQMMHTTAQKVTGFEKSPCCGSVCWPGHSARSSRCGLLSCEI